MMSVRMTSVWKFTLKFGINKSRSAEFVVPPDWTPAYHGGFFRPDHDPPIYDLVNQGNACK